ncbi:MAG TPA: phosphoribosylamine--glycine ligase [Kofleriaceae bacterium]|jgi:phosphoribosylamine--glycine ligase
MKILVVGGGGREHALVWRLTRAGHEVIAAPGNPGIAELARCERVSVDAQAELVALARREAVELVVVGPEAPLVAGLADRLRAAGFATFGPSAMGAQLEGSKAFSKGFFARHHIPTAKFEVVATIEDADAAIQRIGACVVKADGLAAGKGVVVAADANDARAAAREMLDGRFGAAGARIVIEQKITGREISVLAITDGKRLEVLPEVEDHKAIFDGDRGPNTGGMGTVCPAWAPDGVPVTVMARIRSEILEPTVRGLAADGIDYRGVLYAGVMVEASGAPYLLEYNCRFGDPETQPILARLRGDLGAVLLGAARGELPAGELTWDPRVAACVVVAAAGYPGTPKLGDAIRGVPPAPAATDENLETIVFHAGTARAGEQLVTAGGRVLGVTALGVTVDQARERAYAAVDAIELTGKQVRRDIGARGR